MTSPAMTTPSSGVPRRAPIDYSLYLVTGRELLPPGADYYKHLEQTLRGRKVTVVQIREKHVDNGEFLEIARRSLEICDKVSPLVREWEEAEASYISSFLSPALCKYSVPMFINDNLSVALCLPSRVGLHIGQEDIPVAEARKLLGPDRLLGLSIHTAEQAKQALSGGHADYAGVGPVYGTKSKAGITEDKVLGPKGAATVVEALSDASSSRRMPCVLIGGINPATCARSLAGATSYNNQPDGVAVISGIVSRRDPEVAAEELSGIIRGFKSRVQAAGPAPLSTERQDESLPSLASDFLAYHRSAPLGPPLIQTITSHVSSTMSANIALAFSSSPIMSHQEVEAADLGRVTGAVVLNIGTISEESRRGMTAVGREANRGGKPIVLDPVGVGASAFRKSCVEQLLSETQVTLIKGNAAELGAIAGITEVTSRGVDSGAGSLSDPVSLVRTLARREKCLILLTGKTDYLSDGDDVFLCENGHQRASQITGTGCALGVMLAAGMASACTQAKQAAQGGTAGESHNETASLTTLLVKASHRALLLGALTG